MSTEAEKALIIVNGSLYKTAIFALCNEAETIIMNLYDTQVNLNVKDDKNITDQHAKGIDMLDKCLLNISKYIDLLKTDEDKDEASKAVSAIGKHAHAEKFLLRRNGGS